MNYRKISSFQAVFLAALVFCSCSDKTASTGVPIANQGRVFFSSTSGGSNWANLESGNCNAGSAPDGYRIKNTAADSGCVVVLSGLGRLPDQARIEANFSIIAAEPEDDFGLALDHLGTMGNPGLYAFTLTPSGTYSLSDYSSDTWTFLEPWRPDPLVRKGKTRQNRLEMEISKGVLRYYINGGLLGTASLAEPLTGSVGIYLGNPGLEITVSDFRVVDLGSTEKGILVVPGDGAAPQQATSLSSTEIPTGEFGQCMVEESGEGRLIRNTGEKGTCELLLKSLGPLWSGSRLLLSISIPPEGNSVRYGVSIGNTADGGTQGSYAFFREADGNFTLMHWKGGAWKTLRFWKGTDQETHGTANERQELEISLEGWTLTFSVKGRILGSYRALAAVSGGIGLIVPDASTSVVFERASIERLK